MREEYERAYGIAYGNALNAAGYLLSGTGASAGEVLEMAAIFGEWLLEKREIGAQLDDHPTPEQSPDQSPVPADVVTGCPKCGGKVWDNRGNKPTDRHPDYKCKDRKCGWAKWLD